MLPVEEAFVIQPFIDPKHHFWFLGHSSKDAIKKELFRIVVLIAAEIYYVASSLMVLWGMMY